MLFGPAFGPIVSNAFQVTKFRNVAPQTGHHVEIGPRAALFSNPQHPYTRALLASTPAVDPAHRHEKVPLKGELPSPLNPPSGCAFHRRCPFATERCSAERPELREIGGHLVACHHGEGVLDGTAAKKVEELA